MDSQQENEAHATIVICPSPVLVVSTYSTTHPTGHCRVAAVSAPGRKLYYSGDNAGPRTSLWKHTGVCNHTAV